MNEVKFEIAEKLYRLSALMRRLTFPGRPDEGPRGRSQERALTQIALRDGITQRELMERLAIQPSSMSELTRKLESRGLIQRFTSDDDRRNVNLHISENGRKFLERANETADRFTCFDCLSDEEMQAFDDILSKLINEAQTECEQRGLPVFPPHPRHPDDMPGMPEDMPPRPGFGEFMPPRRPGAENIHDKPDHGFPKRVMRESGEFGREPRFNEGGRNPGMMPPPPPRGDFGIHRFPSDEFYCHDEFEKPENKE